MAKVSTKHSICSRCRRAGEKLFLKGEKCNSGKCPLLKRNYVPGQHGLARHSRLSGYGEQLKEKQKAKRSYGLRERQFSNYVAKASSFTGNTSDTLLKFLESRLDNVVYRLGLAKSRPAARQLVSHGFVQVDGKKVDYPAFQVRSNQLISIIPKKSKSKLFENLSQTLAKQELPSWLTVEAQTLVGKVLSAPKPQDIKVNFDPKKIIEFYSR